MLRIIRASKQLGQGGATMLSRFASSCAGESEMSLTTLDNGLRIITPTKPYLSPVASVGLLIDSGSIYEKPEEYGTTLILECLAFRSTKNRTNLQMTREIERIGGFQKVSASREHMSYIYVGLNCYLPHVLELLVDTVRNPLCEESEENFTAPRIVLAAIGVDHEELVRYAKPILSDLPSVSRPEEPKSLYVGGDRRIEAYSQELTYVALGFEFPGGRLQLKDALTITVMQTLMGGGGSLAVGGLGNEKFSQLLDLTQLKRAKQATKSALLQNLNSRVVAVEYMGKQILTYGESKPLREILETIEEVTCEDIASVARKLVSSPLTMASYGDVVRLESYDSVCSKFCPR